MFPAIARSGPIKRVRKRIRRLGRRDRFFRRAADFVPYLGVDTDVGIYFVSTGDKNVGRGLVAKGSRKEVRHLAAALAALHAAGLDRRRRVLLDVGANIGTTSITALVAHHFERVLAVEPESRNFRLLRANIAANDVDDRVQPFRAALSDRAGSAVLDVSSKNAGYYWLVPDGGGGERVERVETLRLDDLLSQAGIAEDDVDLLWMDVEGHEAHVLDGAPSLLERSVPTVLELCPRHLERAGGLQRLCEHVQGRFTHVGDLRRPAEGPLPTAQLDTLLDRYANSSTDVLVFRSS